MTGSCEDLKAISAVRGPRSPRQCDACAKTGDTWLHLRPCQACGDTHCCDDSPNRHATKHAAQSGHPVIASADRTSAGSTAIPTTRWRRTEANLDFRARP